MLLVSWLAAVVACLGYGASSVLQSVGARQAAAVTGLTGLALILRQVPYLAGLGLDAIAFGANVVALDRLPLFVVQSIVAASVGVTAVIAWLRGARLATRDWISLAVLGGGLVLLSVSAVPSAAARLSLVEDWVILVGAVLPLALGLVGMRVAARRSTVVLSVAAGFGFTGVAIAARGLSADGLSWAILADPLLYAILVHGAVAMAFFTIALQRGSVTTVAAITFVIEVVAPSLIELALFGDPIAPGLGGWAVLGFVLAVGGTVSLSRFAG